MATIQDFTLALERLGGIAGYFLTRRDGHLLARTFGEKNDMTEFIQVVSDGNRLLQSELGFSRLHYLTLQGQERMSMLLFPFGRYFLGIAPDPGMEISVLGGAVIRFLQGFVQADIRQKKIAQGE